MSKISWIKSDSTYRRMEGDITNIEKIPVGVYEVGLGMSGWFLTRTADKFIFNYKIYNLQRDFLDYVKKTYDCTTGNLGILFNGIRGTGKSVSAKILANELNLPVILVKSMGENNDGLISYLSSFNFDCIFFFDEFEKQFSCDDCSVLSIMDGVYNSEFRKIFLLTTNELTINENLLSRPSRIRYIREFGNLDKTVVEEYLTDNLKDMSGKEDLLSYIDTLTISTIDILKSIVEEVNIHGIESFLESKKFFNVKVASYDYKVIRCYIEISAARENNYNEEMFLKESITWRNRFILQDKRREDIELAKSEEDRCLIDEQYRKNTFRYGSFDYYTVRDQDKIWNKLKPGKDYFNNELVVKVNTKDNVVITTCDEYLYFYYIENPNQKPSLYSSTSELDYMKFLI